MVKYFTVRSACIFIFMTFFGRVSSSTADHCLTPNCNPNDYETRFFSTIHFPFRLPNLNSNPNCGYNDNFTLSCGQKNETLLHLPKAGSFKIEYIDYQEQNLYITDPNDCFFQRIFNGFDLSYSSFSTRAFSSRPYTYYNCTNPISQALNDYGAYCMSGANYTIVVKSGEPYKISNCTVIKTVSTPGMPAIKQQNMLVQLFWYEPDCRTCLSKEGGVCGFKELPHIVGCHIIKKYGLSDGVKYGLILGISIPLIFIFIIFILRRNSRSETSQMQQPPIETQLVQNQTDAATVIMGLDGPTIESYPKFVLSLNDALLEPTTGPCSICLCDYKAQDTLRTIPECNHYFHSACVDEWLKLNATCPVCRKIPDT